MRVKTAIILLLVTAGILSGCTARNTAAEAVPQTQTTQGKNKTDKTGKPGKSALPDDKASVPASGTDLMLPEPWSTAAAEALQQVRAATEQSGLVCGLLFVGYLPPAASLAESVVSSDLLTEPGLLSEYPFVSEITASHCAAAAFSELYCLIPGAAAAEVKIFVQKTDKNGEPTGEITEELLVTDDNAPVLFSADSNGWGGSNVLVRVTDAAGKVMEFTPAILSNLLEPAPAEGVLGLSVLRQDNF